MKSTLLILTLSLASCGHAPVHREANFAVPLLPAPRAVDLGTIDRFVLPNGLRVIAVPRHGVPTIDIALTIQVGQDSDPIGFAGLAQHTAALLRKGTQHYTADQFAEAIDFVGGDFDSAVSDDHTTLSCHVRADDFGLCLELISEAAAHPTFPESELPEGIDQLRAALEGARDHLSALAAEHAANLYFGDDDPRGRPLSRQSIATLEAGGRNLLVEFHRRWYAPSNALITVSGDFASDLLRAQLEQHFGSWLPREVPVRPRQALPPQHPFAVRIVDKPDATQTAILLVGPGIAHTDRDFFAVRLANYVLGGGSFSSRLMQVVRSEGGKTYGVRSSFEAGRDPGTFQVTTSTRTAETAATLRLIREELAKLHESGPTAEELLAAQGHIAGGYGLHLETGSDVAHALVNAELDGLDDRFVAEYPVRVARVTLAEAATAARTHFRSTALVLVGRAAEIRPQLLQAGYTASEVVTYTDPVSPAERAAEKVAPKSVQK